MAISCAPNDLVTAAKCFSCVPRGTFPAVKTFLICTWANAGGGPPPPVPPATPTNLDVDITSTSGNTILTWSNSDVPTTNEIWSSTDNVIFALLASVGGGVHTYTDPNAIPPGSRKYYEVRACNGVTCSGFSSVVSVAADIDFNNGGPFLGVTISEPTLKMVYGVYNFATSANLTSVSVPVLKSISGELFGPDCPLLASVSAPACVTIDKIDFGSAVPNLTTVNFTSLSSTPSGFYMDGAGLINLSLPAYTLGFDFSCPLASLISINLPLLQTITGNFNLPGVSIVTLSLPSFVQCTGDFVVRACPNLTSITANSFAVLAGSVMCDSNPNLVSVLTNNIIYNDGPTISFDSCALNQASVDLVLHRGVVSGTGSSDYQLAGGTNSTPSAAGLLDKTTLLVAGNSVNTN